MSFPNLKETSSLIKQQLTTVLPRELRYSLLCFAFVHSKVVGEVPDVVICDTDGYIYEVKNEKILLSLNLNDTASSLGCYYLSKNKKFVIFYLVFTIRNRLLIVRRFNKHLKIVAAYDEIKEFQVYDFKCLGFPQIKITFTNELESSVIDFPVEHHVSADVINEESPLVNTLMEELQELNKHTDELTEEYNHLRKICFSNEQHTALENISTISIDFSSNSNKVTSHKLITCFKWLKVFSSKLALGLKLCNVGSEKMEQTKRLYSGCYESLNNIPNLKTIHNLEIIINHRKIKDYTFSLFQSANDIECFLSLPTQVKRYVKPGEEVFIVGSFEIPAFCSESNLCLPYYVINADSKDCLLREIFEVNITDIASQNTTELDVRFTVEDLLAIKTIKSETFIKIQTHDLEDDFMESVLMKELGFKVIVHMKKKLFYCTSTYLKEVFVALQHIAVNPSNWKMTLYTSDDNEIYFLVNALYELLPDNTTILCDESID